MASSPGPLLGLLLVPSHLVQDPFSVTGRRLAGQDVAGSEAAWVNLRYYRDGA